MTQAEPITVNPETLSKTVRRTVLTGREMRPGVARVISALMGAAPA